jgi:hypothetical protein
MNRIFVWTISAFSIFLILDNIPRGEELYERVQVVGLSSLNEKAFARYLKSYPPKKLIQVDVQELSRQLEQVLPVKRVIVERRPWERTLRIEIEERHPFMSFLTSHHQALLLDEEGNLASLDLDPENLLWDRPILRGCESPSSSGGVVGRLLDSPVEITKVVDVYCLKKLVAFSRLVAEEAPQFFEGMSEIIGDRTGIRVIHTSGVILHFYPYTYLAQLRGMIYALSRLDQLGYRVRFLQVPKPGFAVFVGETLDRIQPAKRRSSHEA